MGERVDRSERVKYDTDVERLRENWHHVMRSGRSKRQKAARLSELFEQALDEIQLSRNDLHAVCIEYGHPPPRPLEHDP